MPNPFPLISVLERPTRQLSSHKRFSSNAPEQCSVNGKSKGPYKTIVALAKANATEASLNEFADELFTTTATQMMLLRLDTDLRYQGSKGAEIIKTGPEAYVKNFKAIVNKNSHSLGDQSRGIWSTAGLNEFAQAFKKSNIKPLSNEATKKELDHRLEYFNQELPKEKKTVSKNSTSFEFMKSQSDRTAEPKIIPVGPVRTANDSALLFSGPGILLKTSVLQSYEWKKKIPDTQLIEKARNEVLQTTQDITAQMSHWHLYAKSGIAPSSGFKRLNVASLFQMIALNPVGVAKIFASNPNKYGPIVCHLLSKFDDNANLNENMLNFIHSGMMLTALLGGVLAIPEAIGMKLGVATLERIAISKVIAGRAGHILFIGVVPNHIVDLLQDSDEKRGVQQSYIAGSGATKKEVIDAEANTEEKWVSLGYDIAFASVPKIASSLAKASTATRMKVIGKLLPKHALEDFKLLEQKFVSNSVLRSRFEVFSVACGMMNSECALALSSFSKLTMEKQKEILLDDAKIEQFIKEASKMHAVTQVKKPLSNSSEKTDPVKQPAVAEEKFEFSTVSIDMERAQANRHWIFRQEFRRGEFSEENQFIQFQDGKRLVNAKIVSIGADGKSLKVKLASGVEREIHGDDLNKVRIIPWEEPKVDVNVVSWMPIHEKDLEYAGHFEAFRRSLSKGLFIKQNKDIVIVDGNKSTLGKVISIGADGKSIVAEIKTTEGKVIKTIRGDDLSRIRVLELSNRAASKAPFFSRSLWKYMPQAKLKDANKYDVLSKNNFDARALEFKNEKNEQKLAERAKKVKLELITLEAKKYTKRYINSLVKNSTLNEEFLRMNQSTFNKEISNSEVKKVTMMGGGINASYIVELENGAVGVFKPKMGSKQRKALGHEFNFGDERNEVVSYTVDQIFGLNMALKTTLKTITQNGKRIEGSFMLYDAKAVTASNNEYSKTPIEIKKSEMVKLDAFDYLLENADRHNSNYLVNQTGNVVAIDNGLSFWQGERISQERVGKKPGTNSSDGKKRKSTNYAIDPRVWTSKQRGSVYARVFRGFNTFSDPAAIKEFAKSNEGKAFIEKLKANDLESIKKAIKNGTPQLSGREVLVYATRVNARRQALLNEIEMIVSLADP